MELGHLVHAEDLVVVAVDPLSAVDRAALERRDNLAAGEHHAGDAELVVHLCPGGIDAIPLPLDVREGADLLLEPSHRLGPFGWTWKLTTFIFRRC